MTIATSAHIYITSGRALSLSDVGVRMETKYPLFHTSGSKDSDN